MGYCIDLTEHNFRIKKENIEKAFDSLKGFMKAQRKLMWVTPGYIINAEDFQEAFEEIRYPLTTDESGDYVLDYFAGEKLGDDKEILNSIARHVVPNSYIEFHGEDGDTFKLIFNGETCEEVWE